MSISFCGNITSWLNELAFVPVDYNRNAPVDEWSGDYGCGAQYFSQQCVGRLLSAAGIEIPSELALPEKLIQKIPPRPSGYPASIETFSGYTGPTFDPIAAAESAAPMQVRFTLNPIADGWNIS